MSRRHAVIIGVNKYPNLAHIGNYDLYGCVNDARLMKRVLVDKFNFADQDIVELHDDQATRDAILSQMNRLVDEIDKNDVVVFHFSGHGSQRRADEEDAAKDSTIMPHDSGRNPKPNRDISDKEVNEWLGRLTQKTRYVTLTFDCCHSGTMTRDVFSDAVRSAPDDNRAVADMDLAVSGQATRSLDHSKVGPSGWLEMSDSYVVISGCQDNQLSHEFPKEDVERRNGALTHFLTQALMQARPGTTYRDVFEHARCKINSRWTNQNPQIEGRQDREVFGVKDIEPIRYIAVKSVDGDDVVLHGGKAHGLMAGSQWTVYPPGTKKTKGATRLGVVEIKDVGALTTSAVVRETLGEIVPNARCVETATATEQYRLPIDLSALPEMARRDLAAAVEKSDLLTADASASDSELRVYVLEPRDSSSADSPVPQVERVTTPTWAVVNNSGELTMPLHATSKDKVVETLVRNLETIARYRNALSLDNPESDLDVEFNIYRQVDGDWELANGGNTFFQDGERVSLEIINRETKPVYFQILDFELTRAISFFYPSSGMSEMLDAGKTLRLGRKEKVRFAMDDKDVFPADEGIETLKIFLTTEEGDFRWLKQTGTRSIGGSRLRKQFEAAYNGATTRAVVIESEEEEADDWKAINRSFHLKRKLV